MAVNDKRSAIHVPGCAPVGTRRTLQQLANAIPAFDQQTGMAYTNSFYQFINGDQIGDTTSGDTYISTMAALPFELAGGLVGGSASAERYEWNGSNYGTAGGSLTVYDPFSCAPWARAGDIVFCAIGGGRGAPIVIACNRPPILVATLTADWEETTEPLSANYTPLGGGTADWDIYHNGFIASGMELLNGTKIIAAWYPGAGGPGYDGFQVISASECEETA